MKTTTKKLIYQPRTEVKTDAGSIIIEQDDGTGDTDFVMVSPHFVPLLISWLQQTVEELKAQETAD